MAAVTSAVVMTGAAVASTVQQRNAQKKAASDARRANIESARLLAEAGEASEQDILRAQQRAIQTIGLGAKEAEGRIQEFAGVGAAAFDRAKEQIMANLPVSGPLADTIRNASTEFIRTRPELFNLSDPVQAEIQRQGDLTVSGVTPALRQNLLTLGQQGLAATGDVAGIRQRSLERLGDVAAGGASQRASALVGAAPQLAQLSAGAGEAQLLSDVAGQRAQTDIAETLAGLAGRVT